MTELLAWAGESCPSLWAVKGRIFCRLKGTRRDSFKDRVNQLNKKLQKVYRKITTFSLQLRHFPLQLSSQERE
jgi:hypothetical protein